MELQSIFQNMEKEQKKEKCDKFRSLWACRNCNYINCEYLSDDEQKTVYHYEEYDAGML